MYNEYNVEASIWSCFFSDFRKFLVLEKISSGSIRSYLSDTRHFLGWLIFFLKANHIIGKLTINEKEFPPPLAGSRHLAGKNVNQPSIPQPLFCTVNHLSSNLNLEDFKGELEDDDKDSRGINHKEKLEDSLEDSKGRLEDGKGKVEEKVEDKKGILEVIEILKHINEKVLEAYKTYQLSNNVPIKTINRRFSSLRKFGDFCRSQNWFTSNIFDTLRTIPELQAFPEEEYHLGQFRIELWKKGLTKISLKNYLADVKQFLAWTGGKQK